MKILAYLAVLTSFAFTNPDNDLVSDMDGESGYILVTYEPNSSVRTYNPSKDIKIIYDTKKIESIKVAKDESVSDKVINVLNKLSTEGYQIVSSTSVRRYDEMQSSETNAVQYGKVLYFLRKR